MKCPTCQVNLVMSERQGIEIDYCPECRGVWLDRGELDKIIERSAAPVAPVAPAAEPRQPQPDRYGDREGYRQQQPYPAKRRKSFLEELFD